MGVLLRRCTKCHEVKPVLSEYFDRHAGMKNGFRPDCKSCGAAARRRRYRANRDRELARSRAYRAANPERSAQRGRAWREANPERAIAASREKWIRRYGISGKEFDALAVLQGGRCAICKTAEPGGVGSWHVDHDHACCDWDVKQAPLCGKCIRALLCVNCNVRVLPIVEDSELLRLALAYLENPPAGRLLAEVRSKAAETPQPWEVTEVRIQAARTA